MSILNTAHNPMDNEKLTAFTHGIDLDCHLMTQEVLVQKAWVKALGKASLIETKTVQELCEVYDEASALNAKGEFHWRKEDEDVHMNLERFVGEKLGLVSKKVHLGRSRNDLIATTLRLYVRDKFLVLAKSQRQLAKACVELAEANKNVYVPGQTHLQNGQVVSFAHIALAHASCAVSDINRLERSAQIAVELMPLGSAALAGSHLELDYDFLATQLGFKGLALNAYDAVGNRDFILEALNALAITAMHWSRFCEDIIVFASSGFGLLKLPIQWSTGSSIMPNKRNPDVAELVRAKSAHIVAAANNGLMLMRSLPTSYVTDLHELKRVLLNSVVQAEACLEIFPHFVKGLEVNEKAAQELTGRGHIVATEVANELVNSGLSFREAYKKVASLVEQAEQSGCEINQLPDEVLSAVGLKESRVLTMSMNELLELRKSPGATNNKAIRESLAKLHEIVD